MRITELQASSTARDIARTAGKQWTRIQSQDSTVMDKLEQHGFTLLGSPGVSGTVFAKEGYPYVLKVFGFDEGYKVWFNFCKKNQSNPYVPKIKGGLLKLANNVFGVRLEPLEYKSDAIQSTLWKELRGIIMSDMTSIDPGYYDYWVDDPQLFEVIEAIKQMKANGRTLDIHEGNIMWRGDHPVIIDPIV